MSEKLTQVIERHWAKFSAHKIKGAEILWLEGDAASDSNIGSVNNIQAKFLFENAYAVRTTEIFSNVDFDLNDSLELTAERYGGEGVGANGGGGRCGNTKQYQLKGIGANCMVGDHGDLTHRHGGLDAPLAIIETIYTNLFSKILPLGAVKIRGLILTGGEAFYHHPANRCWGVIMVRDHCIRPAHFMRAAGFKPQPEFMSQLISDMPRIRNINKQLAAYFNDDNQFIKFIGNYLDCCAKQFGFAQAARIMHGALTPSNITIDGKWLDLPLSSMLPGGVNYSMTSEFYTESAAPLKYALELLHNYAKYNGTVFSPEPLANYYNKTLDGYFRHHLGFAVGLKSDVIESCNAELWTKLADTLSRVINSGKYLETKWPDPSEDDPVFALIAALYIATTRPQEAAPYFDQAGISKIEVPAIIEAFRNIIKHAVRVERSIDAKADLSLEGFVIGAALTALKRTCLAALFYITRVDKNVWELCREKTPYDIAALIDSYNDLATWIFEDDRGIVTLFLSARLSVTFNQNDCTYTSRLDGHDSKHKSFVGLFVALGMVAKELMEINGFSFQPFFRKLSKIVPLLERTKYEV